MAYPVEHVLPESGLSVLPASPSIARVHRQVLAWSAVGAAFAWAVVFGAFGFVDPVAVVTGDAFVLDNALPLLASAGGLLIVLFIHSELGDKAARAFGYGRLSTVDASRCEVSGPPGTRAIGWFAFAGGTAAGLAAATTVRAADGDLVGAAIAAMLFAATAVPAFVAGRRSMDVWSRLRSERFAVEAVVYGGLHTVGRIVRVAKPERLIGSPEFVVDVEFTHEDQNHVVRLRHVEYPIWAPVVGNEVDVWIDKHGSFDPRRAVVEPRYAGQTFPAQPEEFRFEAPEDAGHCAFAPSWMGDATDGRPAAPDPTARRTRTLLAVPSGVVAVCALVGVLLAPRMVDAMPPEVFTPLWLHALVCLAQAGIMAAYAVRARWFIRSGLTTETLVVAMYLTTFTTLGAVLFHKDLLWNQATGKAPVTVAHVLIWFAVLGGLFAFVLTADTKRAVRCLNADHPAPPEEVRQALVGHDPNGLDELERRHGFRAGAFLLFG